MRTSTFGGRGQRLTSAAVVLATVSLAACGGSSGVSEGKLEGKIKAEPAIQSASSQGGQKAAVTDALVHCIAIALKKDASEADLKKYVDGKLNLNDIGAKGKGASNDAGNVAKNCASSAVPSATAAVSPTASSSA